MVDTLFLSKKKFAQILRSHSLESLLSKNELKKFESLVSPSRKKDWLAGRIAAKWLLSKWLKSHFAITLGPNEIEILNKKNGVPKVRVVGKKDLSRNISISISHENGLAVSAATFNGKVGVDLARCRVIKRELQQYYLNDEERSEAKKHFGAEGPLLYWTIKEAYLKALERGFMHSVAGVSLQYENKAGLFQLRDKERPGICTDISYQKVGNTFISSVFLGNEATA